MALGGDGLNAGDLDREITLQVSTIVQSASGEPITTWADVTDEVNASGKIDAQWLPGGTPEAWKSQQRLEAFIDGVYRIQYRTIVPTPDRYQVIGHDGRTYDVKGVVEGGRQQSLDLSVVARGE